MHTPEDFGRKLQAIFFSVLMVTSMIAAGGVGTGGAAATPQATDSSTNAIGVSSCGVTLNQTGATYQLTQDLTISSGTCLTISNNSITFDGMGYTITKDGADETPRYGISTGTLPLEDVVVKNVTIEGFGGSDSAGIHFRSVDNGEIANVHTADNYHGIHLDSMDGTTGSSNITIDQVTVTNNAEVGILLGNPSEEVVANDNTIQDSVITNNGAHGIHLVGVNPASEPRYGSSDNRIIGNTISGNGDGNHYGIRVFGGENNEVRGNTISENARGGITLLNDAYNTTIAGNTIQDHNKTQFSSDYGIYIGYAAETIVEDNEIRENQVGIDVGDLTQATNSVVSGNEIIGGASYGVWVRDSATDTTITDNTLREFSNLEGIYVNSASDTTVTGNTIVESTRGMHLEDVSEILVSDNVVHVTEHAVRLQALSNVSVTNLDIGQSTAANTTISLTTGEMASNDNVWVYATDLPPENRANTSVGRYFDVRGTPPLSVEVSYTEDDVAGLDEDLISLQQYDGTAWVGVDGSSVDTDRNVVTADLTVFNSSTPPSTFGLFADPLVTGLSVEGPSINRTEIAVGESVLVDATVVNNGSIEGDLTVELEIDDTAVVSQIVTVPAGGEETVEFVYAFAETGVYTVSINGVFAGTVTVGEDAIEVVYSDLSVSATEIYTGSSVNISATIENTGSSDGDYTAPLVIDGDLVDTREGTLSVGETRTVTFFYQFDSGGDHDVTIGDLATETVSVTPAWAQFGFGDNNVGAGPDLTGPVVSVDKKWSYTASSQSWGHVRSSPAIVDGVVYVGSWPPMIHAVDAESGEELWTVDTDTSIVTAPAVADGIVYATSSGGTVYAIDADGGTLWSEPISDGDPLTSPRVVDGALYVGSEDGNLYALDPADGSEVWSFDTERKVETTPAVSNGVVYVATSPKSGQSSDEKVYAIDADEGTPLWSADEPLLVNTAITVVDGIVYVADFSGTVHAYDSADGTRLWDVAVSSSQINGAPTIADDVVYVGSDDNHVYALNATTGEDVWQFETGSDVRSSPAVANGVLYVGSFDNNVYAINAKTGGEIWQFATGGSVWSSPAVLDGVVYVGSDDGRLYALQETSDPIVDGGITIDIDSTNEPVTAGESLVVAATLTNTGGAETTETVELRDGATVLDEVDVTLDASESKSIEFTWETTTDDSGVFNLTVASSFDSDTVTVTIDAPTSDPFFAVTIDGTNEPITAGETLEVFVTVANTGDEEGTKTVELVNFDGTVVDSTSLTLAGGATEAITLQWTDAPEGTGDVTVRTEDDEATRTVAIGTDTAVEVVTCRVIDTAGNYALSSDLSGEDTCIIITASDVFFDGGGHTITASNATGNDWGIHVTGGDGRIENVTVSNVDLEGWDNGVRFQNVDSSELSNTLVENGSTGVLLLNSNDNELADLTIQDNDRRGLSIEFSNDNVITGVQATGNEADTTFSGRGSLYLFDSSNNKFEDISVTDGLSGVRISFSSGNEFVGLTTERHANYALEVQSNSNTFTDVVATDNGWHGIQIQTASFNTFENVSVTGTGGSAVRLTDIGGSGGPPQNNVFENVSVTDNDGSAISLTGSNDNAFRDVTAASNTGTAVTFVSRSEGNLVEYGEIDHGSNTAVNFGPDSVGNTVREVALRGTGTPFIAQDGDPNNVFDRVDVDGTVVSLSARGVGSSQASPETLPADAASLDSYLGLNPHASGVTHVEYLRFHYDASDVESLNESELSVWRFVDGEWEAPADASYATGVHTDEQYVFANDIDETHLPATFGALVATTPPPTDEDGDETDDGGTGVGGGAPPAPPEPEPEPDAPFLAVSIVETTSPVTVGETLDVTAIVENTGEENGSGTIELLADGAVVDSTSVSLSSGDEVAIVLSWVTTADDVAETIQIEVRSDDDTATAVVTVNAVDEDAEVVLYNARAQSDTVSVGETLTVFGDFYNLGTTTGERTVTLFVDGVEVDDATVTVSPGLARGAAQLAWTPSADDVPDGELSTEATLSLDGLLVGTVTVENPYSDIRVISASASTAELVHGEHMYVIGSIYQAGTIEGTEEIELTATNTETNETLVVGSQEVTLQSGFYHLGAINITYAPDEPGTYDLELGDRNAGTVEVEPAESDIQVIAASPSAIELIEGEQAYVVGRIYQAGNIEGTEEIELTATNTETNETAVIGSQDVTLRPGVYHLGALNITYVLEEAGTYELALGDRDAGTIEVASAESDIRVISAGVAATELVENEHTYVVGSIYQAGTIDGPQQIPLTATKQETGETQTVDTVEAELTPGVYHLGALNVTFEPTEAGTYDLKLGDKNAGTVEVEPAESDIQVISAAVGDVEILQTEETYVVGSIYQAGNIEGPQEIPLTATKQETGVTRTVDTVEVELTPGVYHLGALNVTFAPTEAGTYDLQLGTRNAGTVEVEPAESDIQVISASASAVEVIEGETFSVVGSIYNGGDVEGTETIELTATRNETGETRVLGNQEVTLDAGVYHLGALNITAEINEFGYYDLELGTHDAGLIAVEEAITEITVISASTQDVELVEGERTYVVGSVYQGGNVEATEEISLTATDTETNETAVVGSQDVTLAPGVYHLGALNITFEPTQPGTYDLVLGDRHAGTVDVAAAESDIQVIAAGLSEIELVEGEQTYFIGSIYQAGNIEGTEEIDLTATNTETDETSVVGSQEVTLRPGVYHLGALNVTFAPAEAGTYDLALGGRNAGTVEVEPAESDIQVIAASTSAVELVEDEQAYVVGSIYQAGNIDGPQEIALTATNQETGKTQTIDTVETELSPGFYHLGALNVTFALEEAGTYALELGDRNAGTIEVEPAVSDIQVIAASASALEMVAGHEAYVVGSIYQAGTIDGPQEIALTATNQETGGTQTVDTVETELTPGWYHLGALNVSLTLDEPGTYDLQLGDRNAGTIEVVPGTVDIDIISVEGQGTGFDLETNEQLVYTSSSATVDVDIESDAPLEEVTLLVSSQATTFAVTAAGTHVEDDWWQIDVPLDDIPDDGRYDLTVVAADVAGNGDVAVVEDVLVIDRSDPSLSVSIGTGLLDASQITVTSDVPLADVPIVEAWFIDTDGAAHSTTVTMDAPGPDGTRYTGTIDAVESGTYAVLVTAADNAGNEATAEASAYITRAFTLGDGAVTFDQHGSSVEFHLAEDADQVIAEQELFGSFTAYDGHHDMGGALGVGFLTADLDPFIDQQLEMGGVESATVSIGVDQTALGDASMDEVVIHHYEPTAGSWTPVETTHDTVDGTSLVSAEVNHFSTYGAFLVDDTPPTVVEVTPGDGETVTAENDTVTVTFAYEDDRSGIDVGSVTIDINGTDVTAANGTTITSLAAEHTFAAETGETYTATLSVADRIGNELTRSITFDVSSDVDSRDESADTGIADTTDTETGNDTIPHEQGREDTDQDSGLVPLLLVAGLMMAITLGMAIYWRHNR